jgi:heptosyltransferase I
MQILVVKLSSLGDVIQTMPVVHDILRAFPHAQIDWVVEEAFAPLVERVVGIRRVVPIAERRWRKSRRDPATRSEKAVFIKQLQSEKYDAVIDFQGLIKSALVARQARVTGSGFRATYANRSDACSYEWPVRWMLDRAVPMPKRIHAVARYRLLASRALGYPLPESSVFPATYRLRSDAIRGSAIGLQTVVFAHGTTREDNEWPEADWRALGQRLIAEGWSIALPQSSAHELELAQRLATALGPAASVWPAMSLAQVLDQMAQAGGVIGVDSGLSHMAVALDLPHVQIFSQPRAWRAGPVGQLHQVAVGGDAPPSVDTVCRAWHDVVDAKLKITA